MPNPLSGNESQLGTLLVNLAADTAQFEKQLRKAEKSATAQVKKVAAVAAKATATVSALAGGIAAVSIKKFAEFDQQMTKSIAIMANVSGQMRSEMEQTAISLSKTGVQSASELAESYFFLASAGLDAEQSIAALPAVMDFATAGAFDMATATDLLTDAQSALGMTSKDATKNLANMVKLSDTLVKANTLSNATVQQFSESLTNDAAVAARQFGAELSEVTAALAVYADQGIKGAEAGTMFGRAVRLLAGAARDNAEQFKAMNIEVVDAEGNYRDLVDILADMEKQLLPLAEAERAAALEQLGFATLAQKSILPLLGNADAMRAYREELEDMAGFTKRVASKQLQSLSNRWKILQNQFNAVAIDIGEQLAPAVIDLIDVVSELLDREDDWRALGSAIKAGIEIGTKALELFMEASDGAAKAMELIFLKEMQVQAKSERAGLKLKLFAEQVAGLTYGAGSRRSQIELLEKEIARLDITVQNADKALEDFWNQGQAKVGEGLAGAMSNMVGGVLGAAVGGAKGAGPGKKKSGSGAIDLDPVTITGMDPDFGSDFGNPFAPQEGILARYDEFSVAGQELSRVIEEVNTQLSTQKQELGGLQVGMMRFVNTTGTAIAGFFEKYGAHVAEFQNVNDILLSSMREAGMEGTATYKAAFAAQRAIQIAQAMVATQLAYTQMLTLPYPLNLVMAPTVAAMGSAAVGIMAGTTIASFDGGGMTPNSPRSGGVDGKGGMFAVLHPNERVTDMRRGGGEPTVIVNNYGNDEVSVTHDRDLQVIQVAVGQAITRVAQDIRTGSGPVSQAIENPAGFGLQRRGA